MVSSVSSETDHSFFNVSATFRAMDVVLAKFHAAVQRADNKWGADVELQWLCYSADIVQMFPSIPRAECARARQFVYWISSSMRRGRRGNKVTVNMQHKQKSVVGMNYSDGDNTVITFAEIEAICAFELENNYVMFGGEVLEMVNGVGAGSPLAMVNSHCYTMYSQYCWAMSMYDSTWVDKTASLIFDLTAGNIVIPDWVMYVDDARAWCPYITPDTRQLALQQFCSYHKHCFHTDTALEEEPVTSDGFAWLQGVFSFNNRTVECIYHTKNWDSWVSKGEPAFKATQDYYSYSRSLSQRKYSVLVGKFCEIERFSHPPANILAGVQKVLPDMKLAAVPKSSILSAVLRMTKKSKHAHVWVLVQGVVQFTC